METKHDFICTCTAQKNLQAVCKLKMLKQGLIEENTLVLEEK